MITRENKMILDNEVKTKPEIEYPTEWGYKLIGRDSDELQQCITKVMSGKKHTVKAGNTSRTGKFHSYNTKCIVQTEEERNAIFKAFEDCKVVEMVI